MDKPFIVVHPELGNKNILIKKEGSLADIIDRDCIGAVPHYIGSHLHLESLRPDNDPARVCSWRRSWEAYLKAI